MSAKWFWIQSVTRLALINTIKQRCIVNKNEVIFIRDFTKMKDQIFTLFEIHLLKKFAKIWLCKLIISQDWDGKSNLLHTTLSRWHQTALVYRGLVKISVS